MTYYDKLCAASSPGLFMHRYLKNEYSYMKIRNPEKKGEAINIIFDGELGVEGPRFIEVENDRGESLKVGEWIKCLDGYLTLRIDQLPKEIKNKKGEAINIIFDGELGVEGPRFIEVENDRGESLKVGEWIKRLDGYLTLRIDQLPKELKN